MASKIEMLAALERKAKRAYVKDPVDLYNGREIEILDTNVIAGVTVYWVKLANYSSTASVEFALREDKVEYRYG